MDLKTETEHAIRNHRDAIETLNLAAQSTTDPMHVELLLATQFVARERRLALATLSHWVQASDHVSVSDIKLN